MQVAASADALIEEVRELRQVAAVIGTCEAIRRKSASGAVAFAPGPVQQKNAPCYDRDVAWELIRAEVAAAGDFGYTVSAARLPDSLSLQTLIWRRASVGTWQVEATADTRHPLPDAAYRFSARAGRGWVRATRRLYQEAARVAMLKADRDLAAATVDRGSGSAFERVFADSVLHLQDGFPAAFGRRPAVRQVQASDGVLTWIPVDGAIASAGDLGYVYGLETLRPPGAAAPPRSRAYLRIWQALPDSSWQVVLSLQARFGG